MVHNYYYYLHRIIFFTALTLFIQTPLQSMKTQGYVPLQKGSVVAGRTHYTIDRQLGKGAYGVVYRGERCTDGLSVAIKHVVLPPDKSNDLESIENEVDSLAACKHFAIVELVEHIKKSEDEHFIIMTLAQGADLCSVLDNCISTDTLLSEDVTALIMVQLLLAVCYLHRANILHRDIKIDNVIVNIPERRACLCDFGFAKAYKKEPCDNEQCGTAHCAPPEVWQKKDYSTPVDIWSLAVLFFALVNAQNIISVRMSPGDKRFAILNRVFRQHRNHVPAHVINFIDAMLVQNPKKRPTAEQLLQDPYMKKCLCFFVWHVVTCKGILLQEKIAILVQIMQQLLPRHDEIFNIADRVELQEYLHILAQGILTVLQYPVKLLQLTGTHQEIFASIP